jgi:hypothetical protein
LEHGKEAFKAIMSHYKAFNNAKSYKHLFSNVEMALEK